MKKKVSISCAAPGWLLVLAAASGGYIGLQSGGVAGLIVGVAIGYLMGIVAIWGVLAILGIAIWVLGRITPD